jgi:hypothetical protein
VTWSLSALSTFEQCAAKYDYRYNQKLPEPPSPSAARGITKHSIVEDYICTREHRELPPELLYYKDFFDGLRQRTIGVDLFPEYKISLSREWLPCGWDAADRWYRGVLDLLVFPDEANAVVYDWKTGKIYDDHNDQKEIYAAAVFCAFPNVQNVRAIHVYFDLAKNREMLFFRGMLDSIKTRWLQRVQRLEDCVEYIPNPSFMCRYCAFSRYNGGPCRM